MSDLIDFDKKRILRDLKQGNYHLSLHAIERMDERNITRGDILSCSNNLISIQLLNGKYRVRGFDTSGESITIICIWNGNTLIITLF